jgi:methyl-accepting chemotaxis protein
MITKPTVRTLFNRRLSLSAKMLSGFSLLLVIVLLAVGATQYFFMSTFLEEQARERMNQAVLSARQMFNQAVSHTVQSQLQGTALRNREIVAWFYSEFKAGRLTEDEAKKRAADVLLSQKIGDTGYIYVVDSTGTLKVHPKKELVNKNISNYEFVQQQMKRKSGYLEYDWKNPDEKASREKSLSMSYFKPWDYIISASAYREELLSLIDIRHFRKDILQLKFGESGYVFVMDTRGKLLIHPVLEGKNIYDSKDANGRYFIREMCRMKNGSISYPWKNPGEKVARVKDVVFHHYPAMNIIVAGGVYRDELYRPLVRVQKRLATALIILLLLGFPVAYLFVRAITRPILRLSAVSSRIADKDLRVLTEFDTLESENQKWYLRFSGNSSEIKTLIDALRDAGLSIRALVAKLVSNAHNLSRQADVVQKSADHSNSSASNQSAIVEQVSQTIASLNSTFKRTEQLARDVFTVSEQAVRKGHEGRESVTHTRGTMGTIMKTAEAARVQLTSLSDLSNHIERVVKSLEQIADNSQMLAINASIEAAEAGEAGKGFAIVATEVQELAIQSVKSTQNIRSFLQQIADTAEKAIRLTEESQSSVHEGQTSLLRMEKVLQSLTEVLDSNNQRADQISRTVGEQSSAISQISFAVEHVLENSQEGNQNVSELLKAVEELNMTRSEFEKLASEYIV